MNNNCSAQSNVINYSAPRAINIGDVFYCIETADYQVFREPCVVCKGTKSLTVNGVTFMCPCYGSQNELMKIHKFVVKRYRVHGIEQTSPHDDWKASDTRNVKFSMYHKSGAGHSYAHYSTKTFFPSDITRYLNFPVEAATEYSADRYIYDDYKLAVTVADALTAQKLKKLDEFNTLHGTAYAAAFKSEHDKKSH